MKINESKETIALKWSESIKKLNDIKAKYGDLTVPVKHMITNESKETIAPKLSELINKANDAKAEYGDLTVFTEESVALKLSELIKKLNDAKAKYGDLTVFIQNSNVDVDYAGSREAYTRVVEDVEKILKIFKFYCLQIQGFYLIYYNN